MKIILKLLLTAIAVFVLAQFLPGVFVNNYVSAVIVAFSISLLNMFVRPLLVFFTLPVTILTFGLFLFVINALIILMADWFIDGFSVNGIVTAFIFSVLLSIFRWLLFKFIPSND